MAEKMVKWAAILTAIVTGLGLVLNPNLIPILPKFLHYILGGVLLYIGVWAVYKEMK